MTTSTIYEVPEDCKCVDGEFLLDLIVFLEQAHVEYCELCGWSVNVRDVHGHKVCRTCFEKGIADGSIVACNRCGEIMLKSDAVLFETENDIKVFCEGCAAECIVTCRDCGREFIRQYPYTVRTLHEGNRIVCPTCIQNYNRCSECGNYFEAELDENNMCESCINSFRWYGSSKRYDYHDWDGDWNFYNDDDSITKHPVSKDVIYLGAELEMNDSEDDEDDMENMLYEMNNILGGLVHYERDGSLNDYGVEMITMPMTVDQHKKHIEQFRDAFECARDHGYYCDNCTGLHVHVSTTMMEPKHHKRLLYLIDKFLQEVANISRRRTQYAEFHTIAECRGQRGDPEWKPSGYDLTKYLEWMIAKADHYIYINYNGWKQSIEFRMFEGTLDCEMYLGTIQFVHLCIQSALKYSLNKLREISFDELFKGKYDELDYLLEKTKNYNVRLPTW